MSKMTDALGKIKKLAKASQEDGGKITDQKLKLADDGIRELDAARQHEYDTKKSYNEPSRNAEVIMKGVHKPGTIEKELQRKNDDLLMVAKILRTPVTELRAWDEFKQSELSKAISATTSGSGSEWVPTNFSSDLIDLVALPTKLEALFTRINMTSDPFKLPLNTARPTVKLLSETTVKHSSATEIPESTPTSANVQLDAKKLGLQMNFSTESDEDAIIAVLPMLRTQAGLAMAETRESTIIDGDTAATHQDSDVTDSDDARKAWEGLRQLAQATKDMSTFSNANLLSLLQSMGVYWQQNDNVIVVGSASMVKVMALPEVVTVEKYGPGASILAGEIGRINGIPIVRSGQMREDLNASGVHDGTATDKTLLLVVHRPSLIIGDKRAVTIKMAEEIRTDQKIMVITQRLAFSRTQAAANTFVGKGFNIATS